MAILNIITGLSVDKKKLASHIAEAYDDKAFKYAKDMVVNYLRRFDPVTAYLIGGLLVLFFGSFSFYSFKLFLFISFNFIGLTDINSYPLFVGAGKMGGFLLWITVLVVFFGSIIFVLAGIVLTIKRLVEFYFMRHFGNLRINDPLTEYLDIPEVDTKEVIQWLDEHLVSVNDKFNRVHVTKVWFALKWNSLIRKGKALRRKWKTLKWKALISEWKASRESKSTSSNANGDTDKKSIRNARGTLTSFFAIHQSHQGDARAAISLSRLGQQRRKFSVNHLWSDFPYYSSEFADNLILFTCSNKLSTGGLQNTFTKIYIDHALSVLVGRAAHDIYEQKGAGKGRETQFLKQANQRNLFGIQIFSKIMFYLSKNLGTDNRLVVFCLHEHDSKEFNQLKELLSVATDANLVELRSKNSNSFKLRDGYVIASLANNRSEWEKFNLDCANEVRKSSKKISKVDSAMECRLLTISQCLLRIFNLQIVNLIKLGCPNLSNYLLINKFLQRGWIRKNGCTYLSAFIPIKQMFVLPEHGKASIVSTLPAIADGTQYKSDNNEPDTGSDKPEVVNLYVGGTEHNRALVHELSSMKSTNIPNGGNVTVGFADNEFDVAIKHNNPNKKIILFTTNGLAGVSGEISGDRYELEDFSSNTHGFVLIHRKPIRNETTIVLIGYSASATRLMLEDICFGTAAQLSEQHSSDSNPECENGTIGRKFKSLADILLNRFEITKLDEGFSYCNYEPDKELVSSMPAYEKTIYNRTAKSRGDAGIDPFSFMATVDLKEENHLSEITDYFELVRRRDNES